MAFFQPSRNKYCKSLTILSIFYQLISQSLPLSHFIKQYSHNGTKAHPRLGLSGHNHPSNLGHDRYFTLTLNPSSPFIPTNSLTYPVLDFTEFYPTSLYASPKAPLHFLTIIRNTYLSLSGDPFYGEKFHGEWLHSLYYVELFVQFPFGAYVAWKLASKKPSSGATELAGLVFACLTAMGSVACVAELQSMGPELVSVEQKRNLAWGTYFPYALIRKFLLSYLW